MPVALARISIISLADEEEGSFGADWLKIQKQKKIVKWYNSFSDKFRNKV